MKIRFTILLFLITFSTLTSEEVRTYTIDSALERVVGYNRELLDARECLRKADLHLSNELAYFSWDIVPNGILGYTNGPNKHGDSDLSYGVGVSVGKKFGWGSRLHLNPSVSKKKKGFQADLSATFVQPLLRGRGQAFAMSHLCAAKFSRRSAYRQYFMKNVKVLQDTIRRLYQVKRLETTMALNADSVKRLTHLVNAAKLKEKSGLASATDIYRAEHELKAAEERLRGTEEQLSDAEDRVREILALPPDAPIHLDLPVVEVEEVFDLEQAIAVALENRLEIDQSVDVYREAKRLSVLDKKSLLPELNLVLEYTTACYYDSFRVLYPDFDHKYWKVGFTTANGLTTQAELSRYEIGLMAVQASERAIDRIKDSIIQEVKRAHRSYTGLNRKIEITSEQLTLSEMNLEVSTLKFNRGLANNFDLIQAEKNLYQEQIHLYTLKIDQILELVNLKVVLGIFCQKPSIPY